MKTNIETAHTVLVLSEGTADFLKRMSFPEIPPEAKAVAFFDDGDAIFLNEAPSFFDAGLPTAHFKMLTYYENIEVIIPPQD